MLNLKQNGLLPLTPAESALEQPRGPWRVKLLQTEVPEAMARGQSGTCRLWCENAGEKKWVPASGWTNGRGLVLSARIGGMHQTIFLRHEVEPDTRTH